MRRLWALLAAAALIPAPPACAFTSNPAGSTAHFLRVGPNARALGMGEAYGPVAEGASAIYWNPAGLAQLKAPDFQYSHAEMLRFFHHDFIAYAHPVQALGGTLGASANFFYQDSMPLVTNTNQQVGSFRPHSEAYTVAYARSLSVGDEHMSMDRRYFQDLWNYPRATRPLEHGNEMWVGDLMVGGALKLIYEQIHTQSAVAVAFDSGVIFRPTETPEFSLSFAALNIGTRPRFHTKTEDLPAEIDIGAAYNFLWAERRFVPAVEISVPYYGRPFGKLGLEYSTTLTEGSAMAFRLGYKSLTIPELDPLTGLTGGMGIALRQISLDLAFQPMAQLGESYRGTLSYRF